LKRGWIRPIQRGAAPCLAIDSVVRAVGRIVVWVEAAAEVSTASTSSLSRPEPKTWSPRKLRASSECSPSASTPAKAIAAVPTSR
jgi:hypothetical protein